MAVQSVNVPVSVGGMDVAPGDLIHMDENGAVKFPARACAGDASRTPSAMLDDEAAPAGAAAQGQDCGRSARRLVWWRLHAEEGMIRRHVRR